MPCAPDQPTGRTLLGNRCRERETAEAGLRLPTLFRKSGNPCTKQCGKKPASRIGLNQETTPGRGAPATLPGIHPAPYRPRRRPHDCPERTHVATKAADSRSRADGGPPSEIVDRPGESPRPAAACVLPRSPIQAPARATGPIAPSPGTRTAILSPKRTLLLAASFNEIGQPWEADQSLTTFRNPSCSGKPADPIDIASLSCVISGMITARRGRPEGRHQDDVGPTSTGTAGSFPWLAP